MKIHKEKKFNFVNKVFNDVYHKYDLMNDVMSLGSHRIWKKQLISWMKPNKYQKIKENDFLLIMNTGAYGMSLASNYCFRSKPSEILIDKNKIKLIRKKQNINNLV